MMGLKFKEMSPGHGRVDSGGRSRLQWKENAGKNVSIVSRNMEFYNHYCVSVFVFLCLVSFTLVGWSSLSAWALAS